MGFDAEQFYDDSDHVEGNKVQINSFQIPPSIKVIQLEEKPHFIFQPPLGKHYQHCKEFDTIYHPVLVEVPYIEHGYRIGKHEYLLELFQANSKRINQHFEPLVDRLYPGDRLFDYELIYFEHFSIMQSANNITEFLPATVLVLNLAHLIYK